MPGPGTVPAREPRFSLNVVPTAGFTGVVTLSVSSSPVGPTWTLSPSSLTSGTSILAVSRQPKAGAFTLVVRATSGGATHSATVFLTMTK